MHVQGALRPFDVMLKGSPMRSDRAIGRPTRSALVRALALAAILIAALFAFLSSVARPGAGPMERSSFRGGAGYWLLAKDGGVFAFGDAKFYGPNRNQGNDIAGMAATATGLGYWTVDDDGDVFNYGDAKDYGSRPGPDIDDIVGFTARSQGDGYWMVSRDGAVYAFGAAQYLGSANTLKLSKPIVGMASTPSGQGYWLIAGDGGVFAYGDARFFGSTGAIKLAKPITDFGPSPDGKGYRFIGSDGGVFSYGTAGFFGSTGAIRLNQPVVGFATTATGNGYWLVGQDGGVFSFGDATYFGSTGGIQLNSPIVAIVATPRIKIAPVANDDTATVDEDGSVTIAVEENDTHALPAAVSVDAKPAHGTATVSGTKIVYTPAANYNGSDTFTYKLTDTVGHSATGTVTVTVIAVNDPPTISNIADRLINAGTSTGAMMFTVGDPETSTSALNPAGSSDNTTLVPNGNILFGGSGANRTVTVTPAANQSGTAHITVTVTDGNGATGSDQFTLTVNALPGISNISDQSTNEDTAVGPVTFTISDAETTAANLTLSGGSSNTALVPDANITFDRSGVTPKLTVMPATNQSGSATITVTVDDGNGGSVFDTFIVTVNPVNDAPTISDIANLSTNEDTATAALGFTVGDIETPAASLTVSASSSDQLVVADSGIVLGGSGANRTVTVSPAANQSGTATITVTVDDGTATGADTFVLTVNAVNDPPTISNIADLSTNEDTATAALGFTVGDAETAAGSLTVTATSSDQSVVADGGIVLAGAGANRTVTVSPVANQSGSATITVTVSDGNGGTASDTFVLTVDPDTQPVANDDGASQILGLNLSIDVLSNDSGLDNGPVTVTINAGTLDPIAEGLATVESDGTITLVPSGLTLSFTFDYTVTDADGDSDTGTVSVLLL
jgi:hypothetical protein